MPRSRDLRVGGRQIEDGVAAGRDVHRLRPLVPAAAERERLVGLDGVVPGPELHLDGPVERGDDAPRLRRRRIVADEERIARRRRRRAIRIGEHDPDAQHAEACPVEDDGRTKTSAVNARTRSNRPLIIPGAWFDTEPASPS